jgi:hypothetical protein
MLGDRLTRDGQIAGERGGRRLAAGQQGVEEPAAGRVGDRRPELIDVVAASPHC